DHISRRIAPAEACAARNPQSLASRAGIVIRNTVRRAPQPDRDFRQPPTSARTTFATLALHPSAAAENIDIWRGSQDVDSVQPLPSPPPIEDQSNAFHSAAEAFATLPMAARTSRSGSGSPAATACCRTPLTAARTP